MTIHPTTGGPSATTPRAGPSPSRLSTVLARVSHHWNNSPYPAVRLARRHLDGLRPVTPASRSVAEGRGASFVYAGLPAGHLNVLGLLERRREALGGGTARVAPVSTTWSQLRRGDFPEGDIILVGAESARMSQLPPQRSFVAPFRVHLVVDTDTDPETVRSRISKRERWEFSRNSREHQWTMQEDSTVQALSFFYHRMHLPTMRVRHREQSRTESLPVAQHCILSRGRLFFLFQDGHPVAGVLCRQNSRTLTTRLLGVLDGEAVHYDSGAFKAVYHQLLAWAAQQPSVSEVDFFGTEAFISKGIFQWKRKFHPRVVLPPNHFQTKRLYIAVRRDTADVRDFLVANPFLQMAGAELQPVYFCDSDRPARTDISAKTAAGREPAFVDLDEMFGQAGTGSSATPADRVRRG